MRDLICPNCGNADPERQQAVLQEHIVRGQVTGQTLMGYRCEVCGHALAKAGESADASTSGAH
jgi:predicted RNA-binding Zn-ribbon protein involved in translation (DUF1610 family)